MKALFRTQIAGWRRFGDAIIIKQSFRVPNSANYLNFSTKSSSKSKPEDDDFFMSIAPTGEEGIDVQTEEKQSKKGIDAFSDESKFCIDHVTGGDLRFDKWVKEHYPSLPYGLIQKSIRQKKIKVFGYDGLQVKNLDASDKLVWGQKIVLPVSLLAAVTTKSGEPGTSPTTPRVKREQIELTPEETKEVQSWVLFRNEHVIVINKPHGLASQGGTKQRIHLDSVLDALRFGSKELPRLVHRLDKDTSGALALARTRESAASLMKWFEDKTVLKKGYWAFLTKKPDPPEGRISMPLKKVNTNTGDRVIPAEEANDPYAKPAITEYKTLSHSGKFGAWVSMHPITGRTHQLRVHSAAALSCPILGDHKYGVGSPEHFDESSGKNAPLHLHARTLVLPYKDQRGRHIQVHAPLPPHMSKTWKYYGFDANLKEDLGQYSLKGGKK